MYTLKFPSLPPFHYLLRFSVLNVVEFCAILYDQRLHFSGFCRILFLDKWVHLQDFEKNDEIRPLLNFLTALRYLRCRWQNCSLSFWEVRMSFLQEMCFRKKNCLFKIFISFFMVRGPRLVYFAMFKLYTYICTCTSRMYVSILHSAVRYLYGIL